MIEQAYIRVQGINGNKNMVSVSLEVFVNKELCLDGKPPISYFNYIFEPIEDENSPRWDKQAYEYLKTLSEFEGAINV
ncbi:hypothetical protein [Paenibacillus sp. FSL R5-0908]|uniref:hypothetical protein n=1 Tax=Paenibacillus sp. FSL R5-0908 TaxID=2921664 RepID=UPI0030FA90AF